MQVRVLPQRRQTGDTVHRVLCRSIHRQRRNQVGEFLPDIVLFIVPANRLVLAPGGLRAFSLRQRQTAPGKREHQRVNLRT